MGKKGETLLLPKQEMGVETQNCGSHLLAFWRARGIEWSKKWVWVTEMAAEIGRYHLGLPKTQGQLMCFKTLFCYT
jgi:hypothetical protein